jgi:hypothetical protein
MSKSSLPIGWDAARVKRVAELTPNGDAQHRCSCQTLFGCGYTAMVVLCLHLNLSVSWRSRSYYGKEHDMVK